MFRKLQVSLRHPEYINGVKQVQNPVHRIAISIWYSDWFRCWFLMIPWWELAIVLLLRVKFKVPITDDWRGVIAALCLTPFWIGIIFNDYTNLYRIGLDTNHKPLKVKEERSNEC